MINYGTGQDLTWFPALEEVQFTIHVEDQPITCRITHDRLSREFGEPGEGKDWFDVAKEHFNDITNVAELDAKIVRRDFGPDGSILLK